MSEAFGLAMKAARDSRNWSQNKLAEKLAGPPWNLKLDSSAITRLEKGTRNVKFTEAAQIAEALEFSLEDVWESQLKEQPTGGLVQERAVESPSLDREIGARIQRLRVDAQYSQEEFLAHLRPAGLDWSQGTLSRIETGLRPLRFSEAMALASVLVIEVADLAGADGGVAATQFRRRAELARAKAESEALAEYIDALEGLVAS